MLPQLTPLPCPGHPVAPTTHVPRGVAGGPCVPMGTSTTSTGRHQYGCGLFRVGACPPAWMEHVSMSNSGKPRGEIPIPESTGLGFYQGSLTQAEEQLDARRGPVRALGGFRCECFVSEKLLKWGLESLG